jgi:hypothetical protein
MIAAIVVLTSASASAAIPWDPDWGCGADSQFCGDETDTSDPNAGGYISKNDYSLGGSYTKCTAVAVWGQMCTDCTYNQYNVAKCSWVKYSRSCGCKQQSRPGTALSDCFQEGSCTYDSGM